LTEGASYIGFYIHVRNFSAEYISPIHASDFIFSKVVNVEPCKGTRIAFNGLPLFKTFWETLQGKLQYLSCLSSPIGTPFLFVEETKRAVASYCRVGQGHVVMIPYPSLRQDCESGPITSAEFSDALVATAALLRQASSGEVVLPEWAEAVTLPGEQDAKLNRVALENEQKKLTERVANADATLQRFRQDKLLLCGKHEPLRKAVKQLLQDLGVTANDGPEGRDDLILDYNGMPGVAEVKGNVKSSGESDAAQLEKWVSNYVLAHGKTAKGFLIINAYNETPVADRKEPAFPNQMLKYSCDRNHCLITTRQLLGIFLRARQNPAERDALVKSLFGTVGVYKGFENTPGSATLS